MTLDARDVIAFSLFAAVIVALVYMKRKVTTGVWFLCLWTGGAILAIFMWFAGAR